MSGVNKVILVGRLGNDPELRVVNDRSVCNMSVATSESWTDKSGAKQEKTEWHRVVVWGPTANNCGKYLSKGSMVYIEGKLQTRHYKDKTGADKYSTEVDANSVVFLDSKKDAATPF